MCMEGVRLSLSIDPTCVDKPGLWFFRQKLSNNVVKDMRTPLMVAATYGSIDVVDFLLYNVNANVNRVCGNDQTTALHCAASGGALNVVKVVQLLLEAGADLYTLDGKRQRARDVIVVPNLMLEKLL